LHEQLREPADRLSRFVKLRPPLFIAAILEDRVAVARDRETNRIAPFGASGRWTSQEMVPTSERLASSIASSANGRSTVCG
jgi:hypothetical protein